VGDAGVVFDEAEEDFVVGPGRQVVDVMFFVNAAGAGS
jgi:hypothetical protein